MTADEGSRAAAYVRMSSDRQELSIGTQLTAIRGYAATHGLDVVTIFEDLAKSGLQIANREGMKQLLREVLDEPRSFDVVLVYDVSRWGRFQDIDAAAYYEYTCRLNGVRVIYVQESFGTDEEPMTALLKTLKRAMAAEYARELGVKTRAGQDRAIQLGFQMGQLPCIGLTRVAVDRLGAQRPLARMQRKAIQGERIAWIPASPAEQALVRRAFGMYVANGATINGVARQLRREGVVTQDGGLFTAAKLDRLLRCEALAGNFVWGSERYAAGPARKKRLASRGESTVEAVVPVELWAAVRDKLWGRRRLRRDKEQLLQVLRDKLVEYPELSTLDLEALGLSSKKAYANAFGSVSRALELAGRDSKLVRVLHERRKLAGRSVGDRLTRDVAALLNRHGLTCRIHPRSRVLILQGEFRVRIQVVWPRTYLGTRRWHVLKKARRPGVELILLAQMDSESTALRFMLHDQEGYRASAPWLDEDPAPDARPITTADGIVKALRTALAARALLPAGC